MPQPPEDPALRCPHCRGWGWVQISHDPDVDADCATCRGTGITTTPGEQP